MSARRKKRGGGRALALLYLLAAVVWLAVCGVGLVRDALRRDAMPTVQLGPLDFDDQFGIYVPEDYDQVKWFVSTDPDPQLVLHFAGGRPVGRLGFYAQAANRGGGEMVLYYTTAAGQPFSERQKLWARQAADGHWFFDLGGRTVHALRLDPDSMGGVYWQVERVVLNDAKPWPAYFVPDALQVALLLGLPLLVWAVLGEALAFARPLLARRQLEARWRQRAAAQRARRGKPRRKAEGERAEEPRVVAADEKARAVAPGLPPQASRPPKP